MFILAVMFAVYAAIGFGSTYFLVGSGANYTRYAQLAGPHEGPLNPQKAEEALQNYQVV
jgi:hypothetical protein